MTTKIEWTDQTWNPLTGCAKVSAGCKHCYAERLWPRLSADGMPYSGRQFTDIRCHPERLDQPLRWRKPRRVFANSMSDLFHPDVPDEFIDRVFGVMALAQEHEFQVLTKRPGRMQKYLSEEYRHEAISIEAVEIEADRAAKQPDPYPWPLPNVWMGVSVEDQATADERIPLLLQTPARVRFISAEPLLGAINLETIGNACFDRRAAVRAAMRGPMALNEEQADAVTANPELDWIIVGGESGPGARPMHPVWARSLRDQCAAAGVPFFFKQWGEWFPRGLEKMSDGREPQDVDPQCTKWPNVIRLTESGGNGKISEECDGGEDSYMQRVGKRLAGRFLHGHTHDEYPTP